MGDGYAKRDHHRVYASPYVTFPPKYEALASDVEAMRAFEQEQARASEERERRAREAQQARLDQARGREISHSKPELAARRDEDKCYELNRDVRAPPRSTYSASYERYRFESPVRCPPNQFARSVQYSSSVRAGSKPADLIELQDSWSKTAANRRFHSAFHSNSVDLRLPGGKKKVSNIPAAMAWKFNFFGSIVKREPRKLLL